MSNESTEPGTNNYADYDGGLVELGLADPEIEQMLEESDYGDPTPKYANPEELSAAGNPGPGTRATLDNAQFPEGSGNPGANPADGPEGTAQYPSGSGNPGPGNDQVIDPEPSASGNPGPNPDDLEEPGQGLADFGAAAPFVPGLTSAMPPILPGGLPLPTEPGPDTPQPRRLA